MRKRSLLKVAAAVCASAPLVAIGAVAEQPERDPCVDTEDALTKQFQTIEDRLNSAMISNDPKIIAQCITDDWVLVNPESGPLGREIILGIIGSGMLTHSTMTKQIKRVKVYGEVAVVTGRAQSTGTFQGNAIEADEWVTDVYLQKEDDWLCVMTHLTPVANDSASPTV